MDLTVLLEPTIDLPRLTRILDELGHLGRLHTIYGWGHDVQARLFDAAADAGPRRLDDLVPPSVPAATEVIHHGKNTLAFVSHFQKRFARLEGGVVVGYNEQKMRAWTGPGYFVAREATGEGAAEVEGAAGEVVIDYRTKAPGKAATWPDVAPAGTRLGIFVYAGMIDRVRALSRHVSIGRAFKRGKAMDAWFVLCREDS